MLSLSLLISLSLSFVFVPLAHAGPGARRAAATATADADALDADSPPADATPIPDDPASPPHLAAPPIREVLAAAYRAAGLARAPSRGWIRRARLAGLVPTVSVRTGRNTSWQDNDPEVNRGISVEARATWRLDRLVFDGRELQISSLETARRRERHRLASRMIRAYYHWLRTAAAAAADPRFTLRADEAAAELDALTDGWFSAQLARGRPPRR